MKLLAEIARYPHGRGKRMSFALSIVLAGLLVAGLSGGSLTAALAAEGDGQGAAAPTDSATPAPATNNTPKDEVVYATLSATGAVDDVYVVNVLSPEKPGKVIDFGTYTSVQNLTDASGVEKGTESVTVEVKGDSLSYQGDQGKQPLPWDIAVSYELDGKRIEPSDLGGKSGSLAMVVTTKKNASVDPAFFDNYLLQITVPFVSDKTTDVATEEGQIALAGSNTQVTFTGMPGKDGTFKVTAQVTDFELGGISFAAVPFSMGIESPNAEGLVSGFRQLGDGVGQLKSGAEGLASGAGSLASGMGQTASGLGGLAGGADGLAGGANDLAGGAGQVVAGSQELAGGAAGLVGGLQAYQEALQAQASDARGQVQDITMLQKAYEDASKKYVEAFAEAYSDAARQPGATPDAAAAATAVENANMQLALEQLVTASAGNAGALGAAGALDGAALGVGSASDQQSLLGGATALSAGATSLTEGVQGIASGATSLASGATDLASGANQAASGAGQLVDGANQLSSGANQLAQGTGVLFTEVQAMPDKVQQEIDAMMAEYDKSDFKPVSFTSSKNTKVKLVQFVMSSAPIEAPVPEAEEAPEEEQGLWDKLLSLFGVK